jgi:flagellar biosynthesis component FlhA
MGYTTGLWPEEEEDLRRNIERIKEQVLRERFNEATAVLMFGICLCILGVMAGSTLFIAIGVGVLLLAKRLVADARRDALGCAVTPFYDQVLAKRLVADARRDAHA